MSNAFTLIYKERIEEGLVYYIFEVYDPQNSFCGTLKLLASYVPHFISKVWGGKFDWNEPPFFGGEI
jgi:hypothetical protein